MRSHWLNYLSCDSRLIVAMVTPIVRKHVVRPANTTESEKEFLVEFAFNLRLSGRYLQQEGQCGYSVTG